ncbi:hypothetical protein L2Y96_17820 [Luteibacter aegosomaticola]|uniref:hypothetical protein n=1 Tax=Luteibacter aegosomaticola TaxID=2911538 RepID=UPI001FF7EFA5|nr:hypothetical protein [Luteibacter aegosomaticola]UPG89237.1 hypothetical protein L2Y96_17820 [Luteibacter aegosomaticola]
MQVSIYSAIPASLFRPPSNAGSAREAPGVEAKPVLQKGIDFSHVTPRQLLAYVDQQEALGALDPLEGDSLLDQVPSDDWESALDVPFNLRDRLNGTMEFHMDRGEPMAAWYASLIKRLDEMEAQSLRVDAFA